MQQTRTNRGPDENLPGESREPQESAPMLQNHQRLIKRDVQSARKIKSATVNIIRVVAWTHMMNNLSLGIVNELRSPLTGLKGQSQFPIHLRSFTSQIRLKTGLSQKIPSQEKVGTPQEINFPRLSTAPMMIARDAPKPMQTPNILGEWFHLRISG